MGLACVLCTVSTRRKWTSPLACHLQYWNFSSQKGVCLAVYVLICRLPQLPAPIAFICLFPTPQPVLPLTSSF